MELRATEVQVNQHLRELTQGLRLALGLSQRDLVVDPERHSDRLWIGLHGLMCERVSRNRGADTDVVRLCTLPSDLHAWLGLREVWNIDRGSRPFVFREVSLTVHCGKIGELVKPQLLRLEWSGVLNWHNFGPSFQTPGAGYPHWQLDVLESLAAENGREKTTFSDSATEVAEEFGAAEEVLDLPSMLSSITIERMHLASAAHWWMPPDAAGQSLHAHAPRDVAGVSRWVIESVKYLRQELARCTMRR